MCWTNPFMPPSPKTWMTLNWRVANHAERLDPLNGLALSPNYDAIGDTCNIIGRPSGSVVADGKPDAAPQRAFCLTSSMSN